MCSGYRNYVLDLRKRQKLVVIAKRNSSNYQITLEVGSFIELISRELDRDSDKLALYQELDALPGVTNTEYDGHFGNYLYFTLEQVKDTEETWQKIRDLLAKHRLVAVPIE